MCNDNLVHIRLLTVGKLGRPGERANSHLAVYGLLIGCRRLIPFY